MAQSVVYTCDQCGRQRGESNHWFSIIAEPSRLNSRERAEVSKIKPGTFFIINALDSTVLADTQTEHICSPACLTNRVSNWIESEREFKKNFLVSPGGIII